MKQIISNTEKIEIAANRFHYLLAIPGIAFAMTLLLSCGEKTSTVSEREAELTPDSVYIKEGNRITSLTFDTLRNSLLTAIASYGADNAIGFCHEKAYKLTATYADNVTIRRVALKYRNSGNKPDSLEQTMLLAMESDIKQAKRPVAGIIRNGTNGEIHFFKPILLQGMCLNCHGTPGKEISEATLSRIQQFYPADMAVNFKEGDLRGAWHIIFKPN